MLRVVGVIRVSQPKGRSGESFSSPKDQKATIEALCAEHADWRLVKIYEELHVSGDAELKNRPGLWPAVRDVTSDEADIIVGAHSERLWWNHETRAQALRLVENAGGQIWAADMGELTSRSAAEDFGSEVRTSADRFSRRQNAEKSRKAVIRAVRRGVLPFPSTPPGIAKDDEGRPVVTDQAPIIVRAFEMRDEGATVKAIRAYLREEGIERSFHGVTEMLANRLYVGELHFGDLQNLNVMEEPLIDRALFERVQRRRVSKGRRGKSDRLLARLGVLRHDLCGSRLNVGTQTQNGRRYPFYRCPTTGDCDERVTISAEMAEEFVVEAMKRRLADAEGMASAEAEGRRAAEEREKAEADFAAALRAFAGFEEEQAARQRLEELAAIRDEAIDRDERLRGAGAARRVTVAEWDLYTLAEQRALIRAEIKAVWVTKRGRGVERLRVEFFGE